MPIRVLDAHTVNQIAAGEVIERPASVVKELVENALDAGSTRIIVEVEEGGRKLIRVSDNGCGIAASELRLAFERHATSKLSSLADLASLTTLGFRGEALPSVASVARVTMVTRVPDAIAGSTISFAGGALVEETDAAAPIGTTVTVRDLFYNTPAREKFLKTAASELARIVDVVSAAALVRPEVAFRLTSAGRVLLNTAGDGDSAAVAVAVLGNAVADCLRPLRYETDGLLITGFAVAPAVSRSNRGGQFFFVNGRPIRSPLLGHALGEAYRDLLPTGRHPLAVVFIQVPPATVDVNVHPAKAEVRFADERRVHAAVYAALRAALGAAGPASAGVAGARHGSRPEDDENMRGGISWQPPAGELPLFSYFDRAREMPIRFAAGQEGAGPSGGGPTTALAAGFVAPSAGPVGTAGPRNSLAALVPLGQLHRMYIVAEGTDGLYIIDQHAAHERVLFEQYLQPAAVCAQDLLFPLTIDLTPAELATVEELKQPLAELGFTIEPFGDGTVAVRSVPAALAGEFDRALFTDLLAALAAGATGDNPLAQRERILAAVASCRAAVKACDRLTPAGAAALLGRLGETANPWTCPHGRPTIIRLGLDELAKRFRRA